MSETPEAGALDAVTTFFNAWLRPGARQVIDLLDPAVSPDGTLVAGAAVLSRAIDAPHAQRLCLVDAATGEIVKLRAGSGMDSQPQWSPDGSRLAYLSNQGSGHVQHAWLHDCKSGEAHSVIVPEQWAEYVRWSPDGRRLLIGAAGLGADLAGIAGAVTMGHAGSARATWQPRVLRGPRIDQWRSIWMLDVTTGDLRPVSPAGLNVWEAAWLGPDNVVVIASDDPAEDAWYDSDIRRIDLRDGRVTSIHRPREGHQLAWLAGSSDGNFISVAEGWASDRTLLAGRLMIGPRSGPLVETVTDGVDVTQTAWRDDRTIVYVGLCRLQTVVATLDVSSGRSRSLWRSETESFGGWVPFATLCGGRLACVMESHFTAPALVVINVGEAHDAPAPQLVRRFEASAPAGRAMPYRWRSADGLEIEGHLLLPTGPGPHPLVVHVHGGPVLAFKPSFVGRGAITNAALAAGYAVLRPNPRGSWGWGQDFICQVIGDMGGLDAQDILSGVDALVAEGVVDPLRIGVTGVSYGGFMSAWLVTKDARFAAAVAISPVTNWVSERLTSNVPTFTDRFVGDRYDDLTGDYFSRSPVLYARNARTPTLNVAGALDNITPPTQAVEFHNALMCEGVPSELVIYPEEGHGVRGYPALVDCAARTLEWFQTYMPSSVETRCS